MIAFFARNGVAANLLMAAIVISGLVTLWMRKIPIEVFPESESRMISVSVPYRGATPEEVEETIVVRIEEAIANVEGIEEMLSTANSSGGTVTVEVDDDYDRQLVLNEIEARIDAIPDFPPNNAERPTVRIAESSRWVISVVLSGDLTEMDLRLLGETVRDELMNLDEVTRAGVAGGSALRNQHRNRRDRIAASQFIIRCRGACVAEFFDRRAGRNAGNRWW